MTETLLKTYDSTYVMFRLNAWLNLSKVAATKAFGMLLVQLLFEVLGESTWFGVIWVIQGDMGVGDIPGI